MKQGILNNFFQENLSYFIILTLYVFLLKFNEHNLLGIISDKVLIENNQPLFKLEIRLSLKYD